MGEGVVLEQGTHQKPLVSIYPPYSSSEALKEQNRYSLGRCPTWSAYGQAHLRVHPRTRSRQRHVHCGEGCRHEEPLLVVTLLIR